MESESKIPKLKNPRARSGPLSAALFLHTLQTFWKFYKRKLNEDDLYQVLDEHKSSKLGNELEVIWKKEHLKHASHALYFALIRQFGLELILAALLMCLTQIVIVAIAPSAVGGLVMYFQNRSGSGNLLDGYYYAGLILFGFGFRNFIGHPASMWTTHVCMKIRVACCSLIYRKCLRLSTSALSQTTIGQLVNLLSNDMSKFDQNFSYWHYIFISPIQAAVGIYMLYELIGVAVFSGMMLLLLFVPLQIFLGRANSKIRMKTAICTDERLRLMNEILSGINVIKMYTWEKPFAKLVATARRCEIKATRAHFYIEAVKHALNMFVTRTSVFITILVLVSLGNNISANIVYVITATYSIIRPVLTIQFSVAISSLAEVHISIKRIQTFLNFEELPVSKNAKTTLNIESGLEKMPKILIKGANVKWNKQLPDFALQKINLNIDQNQLVAIIGPVGSGKSALINLILNELHIESGNMDINGKISYTSQEPWLFSANIRQNIVFGDYYNADRYKTVLKVCALEPDLKMLPYGDRTIISEGGKSLSGGQRARINLARCVYRDADIYLLDDPISAVDINVVKHLYDQCIENFLRDKIRILVTHQLQYLKRADRIIILQNGCIVGQGTYKELQGSGLDFASLLQDPLANNEDDQVSVEEIYSEPRMDNDLKAIEQKHTKYKECMATGNTSHNTYFEYFKAGGSYIHMFLLLLAVIVAHTIANSGDYFVAYWVNLEQRLARLNGTSSEHYPESTLTRQATIYIFSGVISLTVIFAVAHCVVFFAFFMRASINLHNFIFEKIAFATMRFFDINPTGRILNRFSKDMGIVDEYIPSVLIDVVGVSLVFIAAIIISLVINVWLLFPFAILSVVFYWVRLFYIHTSRNVKRLEGITRSPVYNHLVASVTGLPTVRAFDAQVVLTKEFDAHQDVHSSAWYLFISANRGFAFWLDFICLIFTAAVILCLLVSNRDIESGDVGLVLTQCLALSGIMQWGMRQWCELDNHIISVERVLEYTKVDIEPKRELSQCLPKNWPEFGCIIFTNVYMSYVPNGPRVLTNLNINIKPGEKVGIVGRTGAGKTSIIAALFQLYDIEGSIVIDGVDITKIPLKDCRSKISIIPQEPVLFSGTVRKNLDPLDEYTDDVLWNALEQVELKNMIQDAAGGLSVAVAGAGSNFSIGQKQLICLARAIIRKNTILVMDEATANVDQYTDAIIQKTIRKEFAKGTVITIAHRLDTIMDSDKILVMDAGTVLEFDQLKSLLQNPDSMFYKMVQSAGIHH